MHCSHSRQESTIQPTAEPTATEIPTPTIIPTTIVTVLPTHYEFIIPTNLPTQLVLPTAISTPKQIVIEQPKTNTNACKYSCTGPDVDCKDFTNSDDAQAYYKCCQFSPDNDPMDLDRDNDYLACEKN